MKPDVSVCIPVYNGVPYIKEAIQSVLSQTFQDFELLVLDNRSTDDTLATVAEFKDARLRLIVHDRNLGAQGNWNRALAEASGAFVKILCADDILYPDCLAAQRTVLLDPENAHVVLVCSARDIIDETSRRILSRRASRRDFRLSGLEAIRRTIRAGTNIYGETSSALLRASAVGRAGLFDARIPYVVDLEMWSRLLLQGDIVYIAQPLSAYRVSRAAWSSELSGQQGRQFRQLVAQLRTNPAYGLSSLDLLLANANSAVQSSLRSLVYRLFLPRGSAP